MNADCLKLTNYFGERHRSGGRFLADALLDLYEERQVATSVLLRGAMGFGLRHHLRTDRLLTLSEDLPVVSVAVDTRRRIEALADEVRALTDTGLITLERAQLHGREMGAVRPPDHPGEETKLTLYLGRQERAGDQSAFVAVCELLHREGFAGATVLLGVDGTAHGVRRRARFFARNAGVPLMVIAIGRTDAVRRMLSKLEGMLDDPLMTLERVRICKRDGELLAGPPSIPALDDQGLGLWQKLMIYSSEQAEHDGRPQHESIVEQLRRSGVRGATVLRGIWGFHGDHPPHGDRFVQLRRHVPTVTVIVDTPPQIAEAFEIVDAATSRRGLVTSEMVPALSALAPERHHGGLRLGLQRPW